MHWGEGSGDTRRRTITRWSTYDVSVLKNMGGRFAQTGHPLKLLSPTKLAVTNSTAYDRSIYKYNLIDVYKYNHIYVVINAFLESFCERKF